MVITIKEVPAGGDRHRAPVETPLFYTDHFHYFPLINKFVGRIRRYLV